MSLPTVGRVIHLNDPGTEATLCLAAIVTGLDYGRGLPETQVHLAKFTKRGDVSTGVLRGDSPNWHYGQDCPNIES